MLRSILTLLLIGWGLPVASGECASLVTSVCVATAEPQPTGHKRITVKPTVTPYRIGDRFPVEAHFLLIDPARYDLTPSDGSWRYYAVGGVVYRVENTSTVVLEVIRNHRTSHLR